MTNFGTNIPIVKHTSFRPWVQKVMPGVYDDTFSYYELLSKVVAYLNQMNDQQNEIIDWMETVVDEQNKDIEMLKKLFISFRGDMTRAFKEFTDENRKEMDEFKRDVVDKLLGEKVGEILKEWFDNGKLAEIINEKVFDMKADKVDVGDIKKLGLEPIDIVANINSRGLNVLNYGVKNDGSEDVTLKLQEAFDYAKSKKLDIFIPKGTYLTKSLLLEEFTGKLTCHGILKAVSGVKIERLLDISKSKNMLIDGIEIDMSQSDVTDTTTDRCEIGLYMKDVRDIVINNSVYRNCRVGRPLFVTGTSSNKPNTVTDGSVNVEINTPKIYGITYPFVDEGCYPVFSSNFYAGDGEGTYFGASNGIKISDVTMDKTVYYPATTKNITVNNMYAENCDRIAILNVDTINFTDALVLNAWTRGYNFSPTCTNFTVKGGKVYGGDATQLATAYGCSNGSFDNIQVYPSSRPTGEKTSIKSYVGCENITYSNISGVGNYDRSIYTHSSKNITFDNVKLNRNSTTLARAIDIRANQDVLGSTYVVSGIKIKNCYLEGNSILELQTNVSNSTIATGGITIENCDFDSRADFFYASSNYVDGKGCVRLIGNTFKSTGTQTILNPKIFSTIRDNVGFMFKTIETIVTDKLSIIHSFPSVYFFVPAYGTGNTAGDMDRNPDVILYKDGVPMIYGIDWFCDGSMGNNKMDNRIRVDNSEKIPVGSKLTLIRRS